jgi:hypothetical protein
MCCTWLPCVQADPEAEALLELPDGFARLLVHGLAQFHGLLSSTRVVGGSKLVSVRIRPHLQQQQTAGMPAAAGSSAAAAAAAVSSPTAAAVIMSASLEADGAPGSNAEGCGASPAADAAGIEVAAGDAAAVAGGDEHGSRAAHWLLQQDAITCCDVVMALHELGSSFDQRGLVSYMKTHVHGSVSDMHSDDYVMV